MPSTALNNPETADFPETSAKSNSPSESHDLDILIVGAGFGGIYALHQYRKLGFSLKLYEGASDYGGVWNRSRYPGARVDSELPYYQLAIPEVYNTFSWTERFPGHEELRRYFKHAGKVLDLERDTCFNTVVTGAEFDGSRWTVFTKDGRKTKCTFLVMATGASFKTHRPDFEGLDDYQGELFHSADFPAGGIDVNGKKVGIIGNGATGVQILQEMAKEECELTAFIRTPNLCLPMHQRKAQNGVVDTAEHADEQTFKKVKDTYTGFVFKDVPETKFHEVPEQEREAKLEELWQTGGFAWLQGGWADYLTDEKVNKYYYDFWASRVRARIHDKSKADIVAPLKQHSYVGCKRPSLEQDYYEMIDRPNVKIVDLNASGIERLTKKGIATAEKEYKLDVVILATGYNNLTGSMTSVDIKGTDGRTPKQQWEDGVSTYLGLMIPKMPNMFLIYSPQSPGALVNGPPCCEIMVDWVSAMIQKMKEEGSKSIEAKEQAARTWHDNIQKESDATLHSKSNSWYMGSNIPGKKREQLIYLGGLQKYSGEIYDALKSGEGFFFEK